MTITRWKVMAGVLGVSLGGLAAIAGQCPKPDLGKTHRSDDKTDKANAPKVVPPAGSGPTIELPGTPAGGLPPLPSPAPAMPEPLKLPVVPPPVSDAPTLPPLPAAPKVEAANPPAILPLPGPANAPVIPVGGITPRVDVPTIAPVGPGLPPVVDPQVKPVAAPNTPPVVSPTGPVTPPMTPVNTPDPFKSAGNPPTTPVTPPTTSPNTTAPQVNPPIERQPVAVVNPPVSVATAATRFRIVLRIGEGEPAFEVRSGDDLVMKVICEKVDIKSPEKGQSLSAVTATGKVRFIGFGSEGSCESLSFLAGTGEVSMSGSVKIQVKDKLGRVESELTTDSIKYKIDASALPGTLKP